MFGQTWVLRWQSNGRESERTGKSRSTLSLVYQLILNKHTNLTNDPPTVSGISQQGYVTTHPSLNPYNCLRILLKSSKVVVGRGVGVGQEIRQLDQRHH